MHKINYPFPVSMPKHLGQAIRDARRKKNMNQGDLADITRTSVKFISNVERGKQTARIDKVFDLLRALSLQIYVVDKPLKAKDTDGTTPFNLLG